ncbi:MAG: CRISPR system precrRNA processing endoribonuclease RAMP protein Cas6 [Magnetococcales bacterium]|nr:CRISPR system precrRNA processing endoribonuclease RAMP protein Cas6 [Magnetococcales bacterium]
MNDPFPPLPLARYRFDWEVVTPLRLPEYAGSALRGVFGAALRRVVCLTGADDCAGCSVLAGCPWAQVFEPPPPPPGHPVQNFARIPVPYIVEPPLSGQRHYAPGASLTFGMVLIGQALGHLPLIILAWQRALARGLGSAERGTAILQRVCQLCPDGTELTIYTPTTGSILEHQTRVIPRPTPPGLERMALHFVTPLRLQRQGKPLGPGRLTPRDFLITLARRVALLSEFHAGIILPLDFGELARQATTLSCHGTLRWRDWTRWSGRQQQEMTLGGITGRWTLRGDLQPFWPLLDLGQWLHVGKNTVFGLGGYRMCEVAPRPAGGET